MTAAINSFKKGVPKATKDLSFLGFAWYAAQEEVRKTPFWLVPLASLFEAFFTLAPTITDEEDEEGILWYQYMGITGNLGMIVVLFLTICCDGYRGKVCFCFPKEYNHRVWAAFITCFVAIPVSIQLNEFYQEVLLTISPLMGAVWTLVDAFIECE